MKIFKLFLLAQVVACVCCSCVSQNVKPAKSEYDIAAYVWPAYQPEPRWKELGIFADGKGEWQNVYEAKSKRKGHVQPLEPLWVMLWTMIQNQWKCKSMQQQKLA